MQYRLTMTPIMALTIITVALLAFGDRWLYAWLESGVCYG